MPIPDMTSSVRIRSGARARLASAFCSAALAALAPAAAVVVMAPDNVAAQSKADVKKGKETFQKGRKAFEAERFDEAAELFLEAYDLARRPELLFNVGQAYWMDGQLVPARNFFQRFLEALPEAPNAPDAKDAIAQINQALEAQKALVRVEVPGVAAGVFINDEGQARCQAPCEVSLEAGNYMLALKAEGYEPRAINLELAAASQRVVRETLKKHVQLGQLLVRTDLPQGVLRIAPDKVFPLPLASPVALSPGMYDIEVSDGGRVAWRGQAEIVVDATAEFIVPMRDLSAATRAASPLKSTALAFGGLGVGLAAGGMLMGMEARQTLDWLETRQSAGLAFESADVDRGKSQALMANAMYGAAATALLTGAGLWVYDVMRSSPEEAPAAPTPETGSGAPAASEAASQAAPAAAPPAPQAPSQGAPSDRETPGVERLD